MQNHVLFFNTPPTVHPIKNVLSLLVKDEKLIQYDEGQKAWYVNIANFVTEVSRIYLYFQWSDTLKEYVLSLRLYFGEKIEEAKAFYQNVTCCSLLNLADDWRFTPNFNLSYRGNKYLYLSSVGNGSYFKYWAENIERICKYDKVEALAFLNDLHGKVIFFDAEAQAGFEKYFTNTKRDVHINPAFALDYTLSQKEAMEKDQNGTLVGFLKEKILEVLGIIPNVNTSFLI